MSNTKTLKKPKLLRTQIYIPEDIYDAYKVKAKENSISTAQLIREVLDEGIGKDFKKPKKLSDLSGVFTTKADPDSAINHNDIY